MIDYLLTNSPILYFVQSLWRDEAFSVLLASRPIHTFIGQLTFETPLYYILLHIWMKVFGSGEIAVRSLSFLAFAASTAVVITWSEKLFPKHWLSWFVPILFFINPMLLYYAFEARFYAWVVLFTTVAMFAYEQKRWKLWIAATVLGFYTHPYAIFVPLVHLLAYVVSSPKVRKLRRHDLFKDSFINSFLISMLLMSPWLLKIASEIGKLKSSWYFPVDMQLVTSVVGNMFIGYEGTPGYLWRVMPLVSLTLLLLSLIALKRQKLFQRNFTFFLMAVVPLVVVVGVSFLKPLFVNRYLIFVTVAQVMLIAAALENIHRPLLQKMLASALLGLVIWFNFWYPPQHKKTPIRESVMEVNLLKSGDDVILANSPLILFETIYYARQPDAVFLYNPHNSPFPWYVGDVLVSPQRMVSDLPAYPKRAFIIHEDGSYTIAFQTDTLAKRF